MASYHVKGNTLHSGRHIDLNKAKSTPLRNSEKNTLCAKFFETKAFFYNEMSIVGRELVQRTPRVQSNLRPRQCFMMKCL